jgi:hypothetical protein
VNALRKLSRTAAAILAPLAAEASASPAVQLRFPARLENGHLILPAAFAAATLRPSAALTLLVDADHFAADPVRRHLLHREVRELVPVGTTLYTLRPPHRPAGAPALDEHLLTYAKNVWRGLGIKNATYAWMGALWMEIVLLEPLRASYREHGFTRLCSCRCRVPWLEAEFPTLNQALAAIVRLCEPHRASSTANALREIFASFAGPVSDPESWVSLADHAAHLAYCEPVPQAGQLSLPLHFT